MFFEERQDSVIEQISRCAAQVLEGNAVDFHVRGPQEQHVPPIEQRFRLGADSTLEARTAASMLG